MTERKCCCRNCKSYSPEYQGWRTEFNNYCKERKQQIRLDDVCRAWAEADDHEMDIRRKIWQLWEIIERRANT